MGLENLLFDFIDNYMVLSLEERETLKNLDIFHAFKKGEILSDKGIPGLFVLKGCIRTFFIKDGVEMTTGFYEELQAITFVGKDNGVLSDYFTECIEDVIVMIADPKLEEELFEKFPRFEILCRKFSEDMLKRQQLDFDQFRSSSPEQRYLDLLQSRPTLFQRVPQYQLASFLGVSPQSLSRIKTRVTKKSVDQSNC